MVECTAHNGLVAGSNPAKPSFLNMQLSQKDYKILKAKAYLKSDFFAFYNGVHQNSSKWSKIEQGVKKKKLSYHKVFNRTTKNLLDKSIYKTNNYLLGGLTFFLKPENSTSIKSLHQLEIFKLLAIKINRNILSLDQIKLIYSPNYNSNALLLYQFNMTAIKSYLKK